MATAPPPGAHSAPAPGGRAARRRARERRRRITLAVGLVVIVALGAVLLTTLTGGPGAVSGPPPGGVSTITWAEPPGSPPDFIFPFTPAAFFDPSNVADLQHLLYRPLYWFGGGARPGLDPAESLADPPVYSAGGATVTVTLKPYRWSDGETVTAEDVMFWLNMLHAESANWGGYVAGGDAIPDILSSVTADSATQLTFQLSQPYDEQWFTDDELSQITPMPLAWDRTSSGAGAASGGCAAGQYGTVDSQCTAVYTFLAQQAGYDPSHPSVTVTKQATYATSTLWSVVDGPWRLHQLSASGEATFVPNPHYSGPVKPSARRFVELPFATAGDEEAALAAGQVDVGYLPPTDASTATADPLVAATGDGLGGFSLHPLYAWSIGYLPYNFSSDGDHGEAGAIFSQLYFRQAMQDLVDQRGLISQVARGYGVPTYGPVPSPPGPTGGGQVNPYPFDRAKATSLLSDHGWSVDPGGTSTCRRPGTGPGDCGAGVARGAELAFTVRYTPGTGLVQPILAAEQQSWSRAGIHVTLEEEPPGSVLADTTRCPAGCPWELADFGGWLFSPGYYPTGEALFATGAPYNVGGYSDPANDTRVQATLTGAGGLGSYRSYLASQLPVLYQPELASRLTEIRDGLSGVTPQSAVLALTPEAWRWR
jgi:peptide/nickel transport system substrate-binding protein